MSGWLTKLDNLKSQVSNIAKEVFVEEETDEVGLGGEGARGEGDILKELHKRCAYLEKINKETVKDKEEQCENFRQLLVEKEEEITTLQQMLDTGQVNDLNGQTDQTDSNDNAQLSKLQSKNLRLQDQVKELRAKLESADSQLKLAKHDLLEKDQLQRENDEKSSESENLLSNLRKEVDDKNSEIAGLKQQLEEHLADKMNISEELRQKTEELSQVCSNQESDFEGMKNLLREKDKKISEILSENEVRIQSINCDWEEKLSVVQSEMKSISENYSKAEQEIGMKEFEFAAQVQNMKDEMAKMQDIHCLEIERLEKQMNLLKSQSSNGNIEMKQSSVSEINQVDSDAKLHTLNDELISSQEADSGVTVKESELKNTEDLVSRAIYDDVCKQVDEQHNSILSLEEQLRCLKEKEGILSEATDEKDVEIQNLNKQLEEVTKDSNRSKEYYENCKKEIVLLVSENQALKDRLESSVANLQTDSNSCSKLEKGDVKGEGMIDITNLVTENRELKERLNKIVREREKSRIGERKLEAGELSILLKMKNLDLEQKSCKILEENTVLAAENFDLRSKSGASSVVSFPSSCQDIDYKIKSPTEDMSLNLQDDFQQNQDLSQLISEKDLLAEKNKELCSKINKMEIENQRLKQVLQDNTMVDTKLKDDLTNISVECEKLKQEIENVEFDGGMEIRTASRNDSCDDPNMKYDSEMKEAALPSNDFHIEISKLNCTIAEMKERLRVVNKNLFESSNKDCLIEELREEISIKDTELQAASESEHLLKDKIAVLNQKCKGIQDDVEEKSSQIEKLQSEKETLNESLIRAKQELEHIMTKCVTLGNEVESLKLKTVDYENVLRKNKDLEETVSTLNYKSYNLETLLSKAEQNIEAEKIEKEGAIKNKEILEVKKEEEIASLRTTMADTELEKVVLNDKIENLNQALQDLKGMNEMFLNTAREKEKELAKLKKSLANIESEMEKLKTLKSSLEDEVVCESRKNENLVCKIKQAEEQIVTLSNKITSLETELDTKLNNETSLANEISSLRSELSSNGNSTADQVFKLESELAAKNLKIEELSQQLQEQNSEESPLIQVINEKNRELTDARSQIHQLTEVLQTEREKVVELQQLQDELRSSYSCMQDESIKRLTCLIKDKDLELTTLKQDNTSLVQTLQEERSRLVEIEKENLILQEEISKLNKVIETCDSDQIGILKLRISELEQEQQTRNDCSSVNESKTSFEDHIKDLNEKLINAELEISKLRSMSEAKIAEKNVEFASEVERLRNDMKTLAVDRNSIEARLKVKEKEAGDLHKEVRSIIDKKKWAEGELERLRSHLVGIEESYTAELVQGEEREAELRVRIGELEDQVKKASLSHSEASQEANEATTHLTEALTAAAATRDNLSEQLKISQTKLREKASSLRNLQLALEGFQKQKDNEIRLIERQYQNLVETEQTKCSEMEDQLKAVKNQLTKANEGLEAAARMTQQLELKQHHIAALKHEISTLEELLQEANDKVKSVNSAQVGKVDRELVKNLIIGYATADSNKKIEILRVIATVLDFNQEDRGRTGIDVDGRGWLGSLLAARGGRSNNDQINQSIAQAFVKFLEEESVPQQPVQLPVLEMARRQQEQLLAGGSSPRSTPSPLLINSLPTFSPTSTILKTVLDERNEDGSEK